MKKIAIACLLLFFIGLVTAGSASDIVLSWDKPDDSRVTGYKVFYKKISDIDWDTIIIFNENETSCFIYIEDEIAYEFKANSHDVEGNESCFSETISYIYRQPVPVYRFRHKANEDHVYTISEKERDDLIYNSQIGWQYQGIAFYAYAYEFNGTMPVYRFRHKAKGDHVYTISEKERDDLMNSSQIGWQYQGIAFYAHKNEFNGAVPVYRFRHKANEDHVYTISEKERDDLIYNSQIGWQYQGIAFYAYK